MASISKKLTGFAERLPSVRNIKSIFTGTYSDDPARSYMFEVSIETGLNFFVDRLKGDFIRFHAKSATLPQRSVELITRNYMGSKIFYAGKDSSSHSITMTFWDNEQMEVYNYLTEWNRSLSEQYTGRQVTKDMYTRKINIKVRDASDIVNIKHIQLLNAFPIDIGDVPLSYDNSDALEISVTFAFEEVVDDPKNYEFI